MASHSSSLSADQSRRLPVAEYDLRYSTSPITNFNAATRISTPAQRYAKLSDAYAAEEAARLFQDGTPHVTGRLIR